MQTEGGPERPPYSITTSTNEEEAKGGSKGEEGKKQKAV